MRVIIILENAAHKSNRDPNPCIQARRTKPIWDRSNIKKTVLMSIATLAQAITTRTTVSFFVKGLILMGFPLINLTIRIVVGYTNSENTCRITGFYEMWCRTAQTKSLCYKWEIYNQKWYITCPLKFFNSSVQVLCCLYLSKITKELMESLHLNYNFSPNTGF